MVAQSMENCSKRQFAGFGGQNAANVMIAQTSSRQLNFTLFHQRGGWPPFSGIELRSTRYRKTSLSISSSRL